MELQNIFDDHKSWLLGKKGNNANIGHMSLTDYDFGRMDLSHMLAMSAELCRGNFSNCSLKSANFEGADLRDANFQGADLEDVDFSDADLRGANFLDANLLGVDLWRANLQGVIIGAEQLHQALLCKSK